MVVISARLVVLVPRIIGDLRAIVVFGWRRGRTSPLTPIADVPAMGVRGLMVRANITTAIVVQIAASGSVGLDTTILVLRIRVKIESVD